MISEDQMIAVLGTLGAAILVGSGLRARRLPQRTWLATALIWVGIIGLAWAAATIGLHLAHRHDLT